MQNTTTKVDSGTKTALIREVPRSKTTLDELQTSTAQGQNCSWVNF